MSQWSLFGLHPHLVRTLETQLGFDAPTDVQAEFLKFTNRRQDVLVASRTGSGKTFCYLLPILNSVLHRFDKLNGLNPEDDQQEPVQDPASLPKPRQSAYIEGLIFTPTRDLAIQVFREAKRFLIGQYASVPLCLIIGGMYREKQLRQLNQQPGIVISTPGRLWDFVQNEKAPAIRKLAGVKFLVLDEVDRIIELGQFKELTQILTFVYSEGLNEQQLMAQAAQTTQKKEFVEFQGQKLEVIQETGLNSEDVLSERDQKNLRKRASVRRTFVVSATLTKVSLTSRMLTNKKFQKELKQWRKNEKDGSATDQTHPKVLDILSKLRMTGNVKIIDLVKDDLRFLPSAVTIQKIRSPSTDKMYYLFHLLRQESNGLTIVFVNSINAVRKVKNVLSFLKVECLNLHSKMRQVQRIDRLEKFGGHKRRVLVTTDVGARGLDIKDVGLVVHFHTPRDMDTFVHRSGRTARGNSAGRVVIISDPDDQKRLSKYVHDLPKDCIGQLNLPIKEVFADKKLVDEAMDLERGMHSSVQQSKETSWLQKTADALGIEAPADEFTAKGRQKARVRDEDDEAGEAQASLGRRQTQLRHRREEFDRMYDQRRHNPYGRFSTFLDSDDMARLASSLKRVKH